MSRALARRRRQYGAGRLDERTAPGEPTALLLRWLAAAIASRMREPTAMALATANARGAPSARMVLLKGCDRRGLVFFTSYRGRKADEIAQNARVALVFWWDALERQVRIEGRARKVSRAESDRYFRTRPRASQLAAVVSPQSAVIAARSLLESGVRELDAELGGRAVRRPSHWGGYRVVPTVIEFWQGRADRLHDRLRYRRAGRLWIRERLAP